MFSLTKARSPFRRLTRMLAMSLIAGLVGLGGPGRAAAAAAPEQKDPRVPRIRPSRSLRPLHRSPALCSQNALDIRITRTPPDPLISSGTTVTYTVTADNLPVAGGVPCDATEVAVSFTCPGPDGEPTGATTVLATNDSIATETSTT
jgi:hypothetical protein